MRHSIRGCRGASLGGVLFGLVFFGFAAGFFFFFTFPGLSLWYQAQAWQPVDARVIKADLESSSSDGSTTYRATGRYRYSFGGQRYESERIGVFDGNDNIGDWQQNTGRRLERARDSDVLVKVWVDPQNPQQALFDREMRWGFLGFQSMFFLIFGVVGLAVMVASLLNKDKRKTDHVAGESVAADGLAAPSSFDGQPIYSNAGKGLWGLWLFGGLFVLLSLPAVIVIPDEWAKGNPAILIALLFPLVGLGVIGVGLKKLLERRKFGKTPLMLASGPEVGRELTGWVDTQIDFEPGLRSEFTLSCIHHYVSGSGDNRKTRNDVLWQDKQWAQAELGVRGVRFGFRFNTPSDLPETRGAGSNRHLWQLALHADLPGLDLDREFELPMAKAAPAEERETVLDFGDSMGMDTAQSAVAEARSPASGAYDRAEILDLAAEQTPPPIPEGTLRISREPTGLELYHPYFRSLGLGIVLLLFGGIFFGAAWFMGAQGDAPGAMVAIFGLVGGLVMLIGLYIPANSLRVRVGPMGVEVERRIVGFGGVKRVRPGEVRSLQKKVSSQTSQGGKTTAHYKVELNTAQGKAMTVAEGLDSATAADYVGGLVKQHLGGVRTEAGGSEAAGPEVPPLVKAMLDRSDPAHSKLKWLMNLIAFGLIVAFFWGPISSFLFK